MLAEIKQLVSTRVMKFEAVIFDLFGTLVDDFATSVGQTYPELAKALEVPYEPFMQFWRETSEMRTAGAFQTVEASIEHVCGIMGVRVGAEQMRKAVEIRLWHTRRALEPRPDAIATLARLKNEDYKIGLLSNCSIEIPILWPETAFTDLIDSATFSSRERLKKPDPRIYHLACERLGVRPEDCLYIADGENHELAAAAKVGLHSVLIRNPSRDNGNELLREAREWQGTAITALPEVIKVVGIKDV
jgi:putative hydrolase of the HAD superfamily